MTLDPAQWARAKQLNVCAVVFLNWSQGVATATNWRCESHRKYRQLYCLDAFQDKFETIYTRRLNWIELEYQWPGLTRLALTCLDLS